MIVKGGNPSQVEDANSVTPLEVRESFLPHFIWGLVVVLMLVALTRYSSIPGRSGIIPSQLATTSASSSTSATKVQLFIHPRCACTAATIDQLQSALHAAPVNRQIPIEIYVFAPDSEPESWHETPLVKQCQRLPGATVILDRNGAQAKTLGIATSGHLLVWDGEQKRKFSGGITPSRGHRGPCQGLDAFQAALEGHGDAALHSSPFGCSIQLQVLASDSERPECH